MVKVITWFWEMISYLAETALSWKILEDFSYLHLVLGLALLSVFLSFLTFGYINAGGTADYIGAGLRRKRNEENYNDRQEYRKSYDYYRSNMQRNEAYARRYHEEKKGLRR